MKKSHPAKTSGQLVSETNASNYGDHDNKSSARKENKKQRNSEETEEFKPKITLAGHIEPTYYIGGGNGNAILEEVMNDLSWRRIKDKLDDTYTLKWCELKQAINYNTFKEGDQMVNHIPNCNLLTNKLGLLTSLQEYNRVCGAMRKRVPKLDFMPETYKLDEPKERELFKDTWKEGEVWICKPTGRNQGKGIFLVKNKDEVDQVLQESDDRNQQQQQGKSHKPMNRIIQRYIHNPLLLNNRKFDIRCYMLVGSTTPFLVLYHKGYIRLTLYEYEDNYENLAVHLTNQFIQKKEAIYKDMKEDTVWNMDKFNQYINENFMEEKGLEQDWADTVLPVRIKQIMTYCFNAVKHRLQAKTGYFDLYGFDFMVDADMKVWLIEVNVNPCLAVNCEVLKEVVPSIVKETLYIAIDCFEKARKGKAIMPCQAIKEFEVLFQGAGNSQKTSHTSSPSRLMATTHRSQSISPVRRPRTISPNKEMAAQVGDSYAQRRSIMSVRSGLKPVPTPTHLYTSKSTVTPGVTLTSASMSRSGFYSHGLTRTIDKTTNNRTPLVKSTSDKPQSSAKVEKTKSETPQVAKGETSKADSAKTPTPVIDKQSPTASKKSAEKPPAQGADRGKEAAQNAMSMTKSPRVHKSEVKKPPEQSQKGQNATKPQSTISTKHGAGSPKIATKTEKLTPQKVESTKTSESKDRPTTVKSESKPKGATKSSSDDKSDKTKLNKNSSSSKTSDNNTLSNSKTVSSSSDKSKVESTTKVTTTPDTVSTVSEALPNKQKHEENRGS